MARWSVCIVCPDRHLVYGGRTPDRVGVGGGVTARVRLAAALARRRHPVSVVCNCPGRARIAGVDYIPLHAARRLDADLVIATTTGGGLNLRLVQQLEIHSRLRVVWIGGSVGIQGLQEFGADYYIAPSNHLRQVLLDEWGLPPGKVFTIYNGVERRYFRGSLKRSLFRLAYVGYPEKGLDAARAVLRLLRAEDPRFELHAFGGYRLWGEQERAAGKEPGVIDHGLVNQRRLARELQRCTVLLSLQAVPEAFGIAVAEAMAAGCIVMASPVGALAEVIHHTADGLLIAGDHTAASTHRRVAQLILWLTRRPDFAGYIRINARAASLDWDTVAAAWVGLVEWILAAPGGTAEVPPPGIPGCASCSGPQLALADGYHCQGCGRYTRSLEEPHPAPVPVVR